MCRATAALIEQGVDKSMKLMKILYELGRDEDAKKASYDPEYREKLMEEFEEELK